MSDSAEELPIELSPEDSMRDRRAFPPNPWWRGVTISDLSLAVCPHCQALVPDSEKSIAEHEAFHDWLRTRVDAADATLQQFIIGGGGSFT